MTPRDRLLDIMDQLTVALDVAHVPMMEAEKRAIAGRLVQFHGPELARLIASLPGRSYFPSGHGIEQEIRVILGEKPLKGLSAPQIDKNERELVVAGQNPAKAKVGAAVMKNTLKRKSEQPLADSMGDLAKGLALVAKPAVAAAKSEALAMLEEFDKDPVEELEDF